MNIEQYRTNEHRPGEETIAVTIVNAEDGQEIRFDGIRPGITEEGQEIYTAQAHLLDPETQIRMPEEVILPKKFQTLKELSVEKISRNKGKIAVIGSVALTVFAGAGVLVHRYKKPN